MPFFLAADYAVGLDFSVRIKGGLALTPRAVCELAVLVQREFGAIRISWLANTRCRSFRRVGPGISPEPLTDPCLTVSHHTARAIPESYRPPPEPAGSSCFQLAHYGSSADDPPPSLCGHYSASSLLRGGPPLDAASVLSPWWFNPLAAFPLATTPSFPRSLQQPLPGSAHLYAGCRSARKQAPSELVPRSSNYRGLDIVLVLFDTITVVPFRSSSWKSSDPNFASGPFPSPLTTTSVRTQQRKVI